MFMIADTHLIYLIMYYTLIDHDALSIITLHYGIAYQIYTGLTNFQRIVTVMF